MSSMELTLVPGAQPLCSLGVTHGTPELVGRCAAPTHASPWSICDLLCVLERAARISAALL